MKSFVSIHRKFYLLYKFYSGSRNVLHLNLASYLSEFLAHSRGRQDHKAVGDDYPNSFDRMWSLNDGDASRAYREQALS